MIEHTAGGVLQGIGLVLIIAGLLTMYFLVALDLFKSCLQRIDDDDYTKAAIYGVFLTLLIGIGIGFLGLVI